MLVMVGWAWKEELAVDVSGANLGFCQAKDSGRGEGKAVKWTIFFNAPSDSPFELPKMDIVRTRRPRLGF